MTDLDRPRLGQLLRYYRDRCGWSQAEMDYQSHQIGADVDESTIMKVETGAVLRPQAATLDRIAKTLALKIDWLTAEELFDVLVEAKDHKPTEYRIAPELIELNDKLLTYPHRTQRAILRFLVRQMDNLDTLITRVISPANPDE